MAILRLRYKEGQFVPLDEVSGLEEGDEIEVQWSPPTDDAKIDAMLDRTRGLWADWPEDIEGMMVEQRKIWDEEWQKRLASL